MEIIMSIYLILLENIFPALLSAILLILSVIFIAFISNYKLRSKYIWFLLILSFLTFSATGFDVREWIVDKRDSNTAIVKGQLNHALKDKYSAPKIEGIYQWFNSDELKLDDLKGKVVLIDFWTYSCINCVRTIPYINSWHEKYADKGLVIIGVHSPEFAFEGKPDNVEKAIDKFDIKYPVAMDNHFITWKNYNNRYWPAHYLIDKQGDVVYTHFGEGKYKVTENNIRYLLGLDNDTDKTEIKPPVREGQTHETYLGESRAAREVMSNDELKTHHWRLLGEWRRDKQYIEASKSGAELVLSYKAKNVYIVMESATYKAVPVEIYNNGEFVKKINVKQSDIYTLIDNKEFTEGVLKLKSMSEGLRLFAFTFGS